MGTLTRLAWIAAVTGCLALPAAPALSVEATVNVEVPAGKWKGVRLKSLPRGVSVALTIESTDALRVIVVDSTELRQFPNTRPLFEASMEKRLGFSVVIPRSGDYYVIFDNRQGKEGQKVRLLVRALAPKLPDAKPSPPDKDRSKERQI